MKTTRSRQKYQIQDKKCHLGTAGVRRSGGGRGGGGGAPARVPSDGQVSDDDADVLEADIGDVYVNCDVNDDIGYDYMMIWNTDPTRLFPPITHEVQIFVAEILAKKVVSSS